MALTVQALHLDFPQVLRSGQLAAEGHVLEWEKYRHDGVIVDIGTHAAAESLGCTAEYLEGEIPRVAQPVLSGWEDLPQLRVPDPRETFPLTVVLEATSILKREIGAHAVVIATVDQGPFTLATQLYGMERFLASLPLADDLEGPHRLLGFCSEFTLSYGEALREAGADVVRMGDSMSGTDLISPTMYREFALPYQRRLAEKFKKNEIVFDFHICGNATPIINDMVATGAAYVEIDEKTDLGAAKRAVAARGGINGPISPRNLRFNTPKQVHQECREVLEAWMPQGGLFFGPGCTLAQDTPEENLRTLVKCAELYGSYN
jgi:uroporphyrinogen decarboxylase